MRTACCVTLLLLGVPGNPLRGVEMQDEPLDPAFPALLSAAGKEVEREARIAVAASRSVTRVEIAGRSGYIEIDAAVEAALRDYPRFWPAEPGIFSRVTERKDTVGTTGSGFRLERRD